MSAADWLITTPVWGERCVNAYLRYSLPAIKAAARRINGRVRFVVHTDRPFELDEALAGFERRVLPVPNSRGDAHQIASDGNREALRIAHVGEYVAFVHADMVPSVEVFAASEKRFAQGKKLMMMAASRTLRGEPPVGASSAELLDWTMAHRHPAIMECWWPEGRSIIPWALYFENGDDIVLRGFHLHPFALVKDREPHFVGTIDLDLLDNYQADETHVVVDRDEAAFAELSPPERTFPLLPQPLSPAYVAAWARRYASPFHRWLFTHRIAIKGNGADHGDVAVCDEICQGIS